MLLLCQPFSLYFIADFKFNRIEFFFAKHCILFFSFSVHASERNVLDLKSIPINLCVYLLAYGCMCVSLEMQTKENSQRNSIKWKEKKRMSGGNDKLFLILKSNWTWLKARNTNTVWKDSMCTLTVIVYVHLVCANIWTSADLLSAVNNDVRHTKSWQINTWANS